MSAAQPIEDPEDPRLAPFHLLRERGQRRDSGVVWAEGETAVGRLLASDLEVCALLTTPARAERLAADVHGRCPVFVASRDSFPQILGYDLNRGCVAAATRPDLSALDLGNPAEGLRVVVAVGLGDPVNVGALVRNARAFSVDLVVIDPKGADPFSPRAVRASMGNVFTQRIAIHEPLAALSALREAGCRLLAATVGENARDVRGFNAGPRWALVLGHEGSGLPTEVISACDAEVTVPVACGADSLNVAAASAVLLFALG